ncbi:MAG: PAS domain S-box protein [Sedimentisphaerales bacterium]|nr:PAS domain S-box protein [Sedimentisphaerales bacterium]
MKNTYPKIKVGGNGNGHKIKSTNRDNGNARSPRKDGFFQLIAESASDIILHAKMTPEFRYDYVSPSSTHISGYTPEEFYADPFLPKKITVPEDYPLVDASRRNESNYNKPVEVRWIHKDGRIIWTEHMMSLTRDKEGKMENFHVIARDITERKQAEAALQESQQFTTSLLEYAPHATVVLNADTSVKYVNPAWEHTNGWTLEEVVGVKAPYPWWPDEVKESFMEPFKETMKQAGGNSEIFAQKKNGELYWIAMNWVSVKNNGELAYMIINSVDITERKKIEAALKESEEKFSKAFSSSPTPVCIVAVKEGTFLDVNESFLHFSGYSREEVIGYTPVELALWVGEDDEKKMGKSLKETGRVDRLEIRSRMKSGEIRAGLFSAEEIEIGGVKCITLVITDITERKKAQEALLESEEKFSKAFQASPSSISISRMSDGKFIEINDTFLRNKGYTREEVIGHTSGELNLFVNKEDHSKIRAALKKQGKFTNREVQYRTKSGQIRLGLMSAELINIGDDPCIIIITTDITEQKEVEVKLQAHQKLIDSILANTPQGVLVIDKDNRVLLANKALQDIFHFNSQKLNNKLLKEIFPTDHYFNLHKAVKSNDTEKHSVEFRYPMEELEKIIYCMAVKMDGERTLLTFSDISREREEEEKLYLTDRLASLGEMAAGLAHELNNPLTGILALSQLLKRSNLPAENKEDIECIHSEAKRAADIVKNVLLFARNKTSEDLPSSPNEVIKDVLRLREYEEKINNINVVTNLEENLPEITLEKVQLQQVFLNMISNAEAAIKDMKSYGTITITTQRVNNHVNIMVSDNGCGIKKQILPMIFDPFFTTKEIGKGTGLGLSICYSIIVKHGGKISVKSQVNEGTTFTIRMPIVSEN